MGSGRVTRSEKIGLGGLPAIGIGSNTTRVLVAEPKEGQLRTVMEQRTYTRIGKSARKNGTILDEKVTEIADTVATGTSRGGRRGGNQDCRNGRDSRGR